MAEGDVRWFRYAFQKDADPARIRGLAPMAASVAILHGDGYIGVIEEIDPPEGEAMPEGKCEVCGKVGELAYENVCPSCNYKWTRLMDSLNAMEDDD